MSGQTRLMYAVIAVMFTVTLIYLAFAFAQWTGNPAEWLGVDRAMFAFISIFMSCVTGGLTFGLLGDHSE